MATKAELLAKAQEIKNETEAQANTATRVGGLLEDMVNQYDMGYLIYFYVGVAYLQAIATINTWVKIGLTTEQGLSRNGFTHTSNRVTNTGALRVVEIIAITSVSGGNNDVIQFGAFKNGEIVESSVQSVTMPSSVRRSTVTSTAYVELDTDDYVEMFIRNTSSSADITVYDMTVKCLQIGG